jgi:cytochrome c oxidase cbb3-type subunit 2
MRDLQKAFFIAGIVMFALAFVPMGLLPWLEISQKPLASIREVAGEPSEDFKELARRWPESFRRHFGEVSGDSFARALELGRDTYIAEACWHCHTQQIRPVANERLRFGEVSTLEEYNNAMHLPHLFGTRRVGPDLIREANVHTSDWHAAHLWDPREIVPSSVMPRYPWFFDTAKGKVPVPNDRGLAIIAYMQWLGSWPMPKKAPEPPPTVAAQRRP